MDNRCLAFSSVNGSFMKGRKCCKGTKCCFAEFQWSQVAPSRLPKLLSPLVPFPGSASWTFHQNFMIKWTCVICRERNGKQLEWVKMSGVPLGEKNDFSPPCPIFFESCWQNWYYPNVCGRCKGSFLGPSALEEGGRTDKHSSSKLTDVTCPWYMLAVASFPTSISFWVLSVPDWYSFKVNPVFPYKPLLVAFILAVCKVP